MPKKCHHDSALTLRLSRSEKRRLEQLAAERGCKVAVIVRQALAAAV